MIGSVRHLRCPPRSKGFTLIELMVVVIIVSILAAIAYPNYGKFVRRSRRAEAKADLMEYAALAERFHTVNNTYVGFTLPVNQSPRTGRVAYQLALPVATQSTFTLSAVPQGGQATDTCGTLGLNQASVKTQSSGTISDCW